MARPLRTQYPGAFYHITSRGNERKPIFSHNRDRSYFLNVISEAIVRCKLSVHAYCLMENHYHLLLETAEANLSQAMHLINGQYTAYFNRTHDRSGHLFQGRYKAILVEKDPYALELSRYIHLNPVRAGYCTWPESYSWSSYPKYLALDEDQAWINTSLILGYFSTDLNKARVQYKNFIAEGITGNIKNPMENVKAGIVLGTEVFVDWLWSSILSEAQPARDIPAIKQLKPQLTMENIKKIVTSRLRGTERRLRNVSLFITRRHTSNTLKEIGAFFGGLSESAVSQAIRRLSVQMKSDEILRGDISKIEKALKAEMHR